MIIIIIMRRVSGLACLLKIFRFSYTPSILVSVYLKFHLEPLTLT